MKDVSVIQDINNSIKVSHEEKLKEAKSGIIKGMWQSILRIFAPLM